MAFAALSWAVFCPSDALPFSFPVFFGSCFPVCLGSCSHTVESLLCGFQRVQAKFIHLKPFIQLCHHCPQQCSIFHTKMRLVLEHVCGILKMLQVVKSNCLPKSHTCLR